MTPLDPVVLGGTPTTMPSNSWWSNIGQSIKSGATFVADTAGKLARSYAEVQEAARLASSAGVPAQNRPPGTFGLFPQASSVAGAVPQFRIGQANIPAPWIIGGALAIAAAIYLARR